MHYYEVAPTKIVRASASVFTYHSEQPLATGTIVKIPVGKSARLGLVLRSVEQPDFTTRAISAVVIERPLPMPLLATAQWMSDYYATHLATVVSSILPRGVDKQRRVRHDTVQPPVRQHRHLTPTAAQVAAIDTIASSTHTTHLLFGVTGSGKTLVYKTLASRALAQGNSVIVLVPEIALTSQLVDEFRHDFGEQVLVTHSQQTEAGRHAVWQQALSADTPRVVIGPRSALFLPLAQIGLIVVDEMHEPSYKQEQAPRYSALRVATVLAKQHGAKVVFGSATPPIAEYYAAEQAGAPIVRLPQRAHPEARKPTLTLVDMTKRQQFLRHRFLSDILLDAIAAPLDAGKQVLLFHNRRGSAVLTLCENCGWTATDPTTGTPLTLHADTHQLVSHITGLVTAIPTSCPVCHHADIIHKGIGTKLIETEITRLFPNKKIVRFDGDSGIEHSVEARYGELYRGDIDIIIGTQVIAKGIDLPRLETVGIIQADAGLALPDYTSSERVFQLISQTVGRVGRGEHATSVVVQSYQPTHPAVRAGIAQDYDGFYQHELPHRQRYHFPPYRYLLTFVCTYKSEAVTIKHTRAFAAQLKQHSSPQFDVLGPTPAFYEKSTAGYRWQITVRATARQQLLELIPQMPATGHWQYEIDPIGLLQ